MNFQDTNNFAGQAGGASPAGKSHSPFWAVWIVFLTLAILQVLNLIGDFKQRSQLQTTEAQMKIPVVQAKAIRLTIEAVGRELLALSKDSAEAAKIVAEFKITLNEPPPPSK